MYICYVLQYVVLQIRNDAMNLLVTPDSTGTYRNWTGQDILGYVRITWTFRRLVHQERHLPLAMFRTSAGHGAEAQNVGLQTQPSSQGTAIDVGKTMS